MRTKHFCSSGMPSGTRIPLGMFAFVACGLLAAAFTPSCSRPPADPLPARTDAAISRAAAFLLKQQSADGSFRSDTYGNMKDGITLTPHVLDALTRLPQTPPTAAAVRRGHAYLRAQIKPDGTLHSPSMGIPYFVYSTAIAATVITRADPTPQNLAAQRTFIALLRRHQLDERLGWSPTDLLYGGWGYSMVEPKKPAHENPDAPAIEANLSSTLYALDAFRAAGISPADPALINARHFLTRVQNLPANPASPRSPHDDGGFFFTPLDAARNKAGTLGADSAGHPRFTSYGTMTADGIRALDLLNDHGPAFAAAQAWLTARYSATLQPGDFSRDQALFQHGMYFYYAASAAQALSLPSTPATLRWSRPLAAELLTRQHPDGSFTSTYTDSKEDDPLVATPQAIIALLHCRAASSQ